MSEMVTTEPARRPVFGDTTGVMMKSGTTYLLTARVFGSGNTEGVPAGPGAQRALYDVAPTLLELLGEPVPPEMEGQSMLRPAAADGPEPPATRDDSVTDTPTLSR